MENIKWKKIVNAIIIFAITVYISVDIVLGLKNPSAVYCEEMDYEYTIEESEMGQVGVCKFSETENCPAWDFLTGKCGEEYSYCSEKGYQLKTVDESEKCSSIPFSPECAVCVLENETEIEVTKLMELSFKEGLCGDNRCVLGESYRNCPQDCPSGSSDYYCDGLKDGICDPDCQTEEDWDCHCGNKICDFGENNVDCPTDCIIEITEPGYDITTYILISVCVVTIVVVVVVSYLKRRKVGGVDKFEKLKERWKK